MSLTGQTVVISGASRGIGKAIALRCARDGANVAILAKTSTAHATLPGTIHDTARECEEQGGGSALAVQCDLRFPEQISEAVSRVVARFGGIDVVVNNASAISLTGTMDTAAKR
jgi:citronellol/citronellal dehydrogenase